MKQIQPLDTINDSPDLKLGLRHLRPEVRDAIWQYAMGGENRLQRLSLSNTCTCQEQTWEHSKAMARPVSLPAVSREGPAARAIAIATSVFLVDTCGVDEGMVRSQRFRDACLSVREIAVPEALLRADEKEDDEAKARSEQILRVLRDTALLPRLRRVHVVREVCDPGPSGGMGPPVLARFAPTRLYREPRPVLLGADAFAAYAARFDDLVPSSSSSEAPPLLLDRLAGVPGAAGLKREYETQLAALARERPAAVHDAIRSWRRQAIWYIITQAPLGGPIRVPEFVDAVLFRRPLSRAETFERIAQRTTYHQAFCYLLYFLVLVFSLFRVVLFLYHVGMALFHLF
ncbi:hypothetical protein F4775DRAFT_596433 [Biscogniauxia sp. FL1348]|nr:hypothetical protein F4775DRAFT_596433 [Biscogniauxia sp. FL1348]